MSQTNCLARQLRSTQRWKKLAAIKKKLANYTCGLCGRMGGRLELDHRQPIFKLWLGDNSSEKREYFFQWDNLQVLCKWCHIEKSKRERSTKINSKESREWLSYINTMEKIGD